jgi:hypothetical protein
MLNTVCRTADGFSKRVAQQPKKEKKKKKDVMVVLGIPIWHGHAQS